MVMSVNPAVAVHRGIAKTLAEVRPIRDEIDHRVLVLLEELASTCQADIIR